MDRKNLLAQLYAYQARNEQEKQDVQATITLLESTPRCFRRDCFPAHIIGDILIINHERTHILLHKHIFYDAWFQFGGHCDGEENVFNVAERELVEETGITEYRMHLDIFDVNISSIPFHEKKQEPKHFHHNISYLAFVDKEVLLNPGIGESQEIERFSLDERPISKEKLERERIERRKKKIMQL